MIKHGRICVTSSRHYFRMDSLHCVSNVWLDPAPGVCQWQKNVESLRHGGHHGGLIQIAAQVQTAAVQMSQVGWRFQSCSIPNHPFFWEKNSGHFPIFCIGIVWVWSSWLGSALWKPQRSGSKLGNWVPGCCRHKASTGKMTHASCAYHWESRVFFALSTLRLKYS